MMERLLTQISTEFPWNFQFFEYSALQNSEGFFSYSAPRAPGVDKNECAILLYMYGRGYVLDIKLPINVNHHFQ